jgi:exosortase
MTEIHNEPISIESARLSAAWRLLPLAAAVVFLHWHTISVLVRRWYYEPDNTHGFGVPLVAAYLVWRKRDEIARIIPAPSRWGIPVLALSILAQIAGIIGNIGYLQGMSLIGVVLGLTLLLGGTTMLKATLFPILYLWLMVPLPGAVYSAMAAPLQGLASWCSANILELVGIPVFREGNVFRLAGISLEVAEACSGLRSLLGLLSMGILLGYLVTTRLWERALLALSTIPIAVAANIVRVAGTGIIYEYVGPKYGQGFYHGFGAWIVFVIALAALLMEASLLSALFVEGRDAEVGEGAG